MVHILRLFVNEWVCNAYACLPDGNEPKQRDSLWESWQRLPDTAALYIKKIIDDVVASVPSSRGFWGTLSSFGAFLISPLLSISASDLAPVNKWLDAISTLTT